MASERFQESVKSHLAVYKRQVLRVTEDGIWRKNNTPYPHILPISERQLNILPGIRHDFWQWFPGHRIRLHSYFHHLNSSQALCFNLFFPLIWDKSALQMVLDALSIAGEPVGGAAFEFEPDTAEGTNFDFLIPLATGARVLFEIKYSETDFGKAVEDAEHLEKFEAIYRPRLAGRFDERYCSAKPFLANYQVLRNIWHLNSGDLVVFLFPRCNAALKRKEHIIQSCAVEPFRSGVHVRYIEDLLSALQQDQRLTSAGSAALLEFQAKYFPASIAAQIGNRL